MRLRIHLDTLVLVWFLGLGFQARAGDIRFDMFLGYDDVLSANAWCPVSFEVKNDGPAFVGTVEVTTDSGRNSPSAQSITLELPTGTLKRFTIPLFTGRGYYQSIQARLLDSSGRLRADAKRPVRQTLSADSLLLGGLSSTPAANPILPALTGVPNQMQAISVRLLTDLLPDHAIALESLDVIYLSSEKALELRAPQVDALVQWLYAGGHLVVSVSQIGDLSGAPWLGRLLPARPTRSVMVAAASSLHRYATVGWPSNQPTDASTPHPPVGPLFPEEDTPSLMDDKPLPIWELSPTLTKPVVSAEGHPLVVQSSRGRGRVSLLTFNADRAPFSIWSQREWFWASLCGLQKRVNDPDRSYSMRSTDSIFGLLVDSLQIRKLPLGWLLAILVVYLFVIGPWDRWWLRKIRREVLTWVTFPCYVLVFSLMIYWIGYRLRAGSSEYNELQVVDLVPYGNQAQWRLHGFGSVYAPSSRRFSFESRDQLAVFRPESGIEGNMGTDPLRVGYEGKGFVATAQVPIWTSQIFVRDLLQTNIAPVSIEVVKSDSRGETIRIVNRTPHTLDKAFYITRDTKFQLPAIPPGDTEMPLNTALAKRGTQDSISSLQHVVNPLLDARRRAFGDSARPTEVDPADIAFYASFPGLVETRERYDYSRPSSSVGIDCTPTLDQGGAVFLAFIEGQTVVPLANTFAALRSRHRTLLRYHVPAFPSGSAP